MTVLRHKKPCIQCPFRQESTAGWLGASTPEQFVDTTLSGEYMPCHRAVDYEDKNWKNKLDKASHCAGSLIFLRNCTVLPRDPKLAAMRKKCAPDADYENVLTGRQHFIDHHTIRSRKKAGGQ